MFKEFKEFALKGNLIDMAVAFVKLSTAFIEDMVMPLVGKLSGGFDFTNMFINLSTNGLPKTLAEAKANNVPVIAYGDFITVTINFLIVAFVMFMVVKAINTAKKLAEKKAAAAPPPAPPAPSKEELLLTEIRDLLKAKA